MTPEIERAILAYEPKLKGLTLRQRLDALLEAGFPLGAIRAYEKQRSRDEDVRALAAGEKTPEQLRRENEHFSGLKAELLVSSVKSFK